MSDCFLLSNAKILPMKRVSRSSFSFINVYSTDFFKNLLKESSQFRAAQHQTSTSRRPKFEMFDPKFSSEFNKLSLNFEQELEVAQRFLKLNLSRKPHVCGIRCLRVNRDVKKPRSASEEDPFVIS